MCDTCIIAHCLDKNETEPLILFMGNLPIFVPLNNTFHSGTYLLLIVVFVHGFPIPRHIQAELFSRPSFLFFSFQMHEHFLSSQMYGHLDLLLIFLILILIFLSHSKQIIIHTHLFWIILNVEKFK